MAWAVPLASREFDVRVSRIALDRPPEAVARLFDLLDGMEQARAARFRDAGDRNRFIVGRAVTRRMLAAAVNDDPKALRLQVNPYGKPELAGDRRHFNFSRSGGTGLLVIGETSLGIDIERARFVVEKERIAEQVFGRHERDWMLRVTDPERTARFLTIWTRKEALVKAAGRGLSEDLRCFDTVSDRHDPVVIPAWGHRWHICNLRGGPGHFAALALRLGTGSRPVD